MHWALEAAEQGVAASMTRIGLLYNNALGVERDAASRRRGGARPPCSATPTARPCSGAAHHLGAGVARDPVAALAWLTRARAGAQQFADRFYAGVRDSCTGSSARGGAPRRPAPRLAEAAP